jgi:hypothetical protein
MLFEDKFQTLPYHNPAGATTDQKGERIFQMGVQNGKEKR